MCWWKFNVQSPAVATQHPRWSLFSVSISVVGVDRRPNDVCEREMVSYIRIIASHFLGPNNLWDIIKKLHLASVLRPPPAKPSRRLYCQCEPSATPVAEGTSKQNDDTWIVAHGTNLRIRSRLVAGAGWRVGHGWGAPGNSAAAAHVSTSWGEVGGHLPRSYERRKLGAGQPGERQD